MSTFVGFAPADDPKYIMLFIVDEPSGGTYYGSLVAAPYVGRAYAEIFNYLGIPPSDIEPEETIVMPEVIGLSPVEADKIMSEAGLYYEYLDKGGSAITYQIPAPGSEVSKKITAYMEG